MLKAVVLATAMAAAGLAQAQGAAAPAAAPAVAPAAAPSSPAKKELVAKVLQLQQNGIEGMARQLTEQPAMQLMQAAAQALQRLPQERRDALARDIEADVRKYVEEATPIVRDRAVKLGPTTIGALLEERFTEDELRQIIVLLESPVNRKFQALAPEMQRSIAEKLIADTRGDVEPKLRALEQSVKTRLGPVAGAQGATPTPAPATGGTRAPASAPARK